MRFVTITDLLTYEPGQPGNEEADREHTEAVDAVRHLLVKGIPVNPPRDGLGDWRKARAAERETWTVPEFWTLDHDSAWRRDGVTVARGWPGHWAPPSVLEPMPWTVTFPPLRGSASPCDVVRAPDLATAMAAVDARWPCPAWWSTLRPWPSEVR